MTGGTIGYQIRIEGGVRISNGKHEFEIDTYYRKVEIDGMALYYLNSDEAVETLNELLNREEITPEEMNYLRGVSLLDYRRHRKWLGRFKDRPIGKLKRAVLLSYILDGYDYERKKQWLIENGYSEGELRARKIAHKLLEEKVLVGEYKGRKFYYNQFWMEIYEELPDGRLRKKRDFHKWEQLIQWRPEYNILASRFINKIFGGKDGNPAESEGGNGGLPKCSEAAVAGSGEGPLRVPTSKRPRQILPVLRPDVGHPPHGQDGGAREHHRRG